MFFARNCGLLLTLLKWIELTRMDRLIDGLRRCVCASRCMDGSDMWMDRSIGFLDGWVGHWICGEVDF